MTRVLILHGWGGSDFPHWQSQLAGELAKRHYAVYFPELSNRDAPQKDEWLRELKNAMEVFNPHIVICHSLACTLWLWYLNGCGCVNVKKVLLVAPPSLTCQTPEISSFFPAPLPDRCGAADGLLVASTNDKYITVDEAKIIANSLNIPIKLLENAGHINTISGFGEWPFALEWI